MAMNLGFLNLTPEQIQQLYAQNQNGGVAPNLGMGGGFMFSPHPQQAQPSTNYGSLYSNWVRSLLAPYEKQFGMTQQPSPMTQAQNQFAMMQRFMPDPNMTPSGGGH